MLQKVMMTDYSRNVHIEAHTDGYAYDQYSLLYLLSIVGQDSAVKGLSAAVVRGMNVRIERENDILELSAPYYHKNRIMSSRLGSGMLHQIVLSELFFGREQGPVMVFVPEGEKTEEILFNTIRATFSVPALSQWAGWIYARLKENEAVEELSGTTKVLRLRTSENQLDSIISEGVKHGDIGF